MMYILSGDPREVEKVIQENRIRVGRGVINFTPCQPINDTTCRSNFDNPKIDTSIETEADTKDMEDVSEVDTKDMEDVSEVDTKDMEDMSETDSKESPAITPKKTRTK